ncbi:MAG: DUF1573 domain-containing protein [Thermoplasmata archaeon]
MGLESCPVCKVKVKAENLPNHLKRVHPGSEVRVNPSKRDGGHSSGGRGNRRVGYAILAITILVLVSVFAYSFMSSLGSPEISVSPLSFNFGDISQREVSTTVQIWNTGDSNLVITGISTSCGCTSAVLTVRGRSSPTFGMHNNPQGWSETLLPGESGILKITYDATLHPDNGPVHRIVYINSNDPRQPEVEIDLRANVIP